MLKVIGISSSLRADSTSRKMVETMLASCTEKDVVETELLDLAKYPNLPFCDGRYKPDTYGAQVSQLQEKMMEADAVIVSTPVYNGSYSPVLKNFLDLMPRFSLKGKPVALLSASGGADHMNNPLSHLADVFSNMKALTYPERTNASSLDLQDGNLSPSLVKRLQDTGKGFIELLKRLQPQNKKAA